MSAAAVSGALLLAPIGLGFVEAVGYRRGRFLRAFWELPLDAKLDHIGRNEAAWWLMYVPWLATVTVTTGGLAGLAFVLSDVVGWVGFGWFVLAAMAWLMAITQQSAGLGEAARQRAATAETPPWAVATARVSYVLELFWVGAANLAAVAYGVAVLRTDVLPGWLGWAVIITGIAVPLLALAFRDAFPHLALPALLALGVALVMT
ncbi:MAG TPA: hypothetical protein VFZ72_23230 [Jiangellaceae bacterium]